MYHANLREVWVMETIDLQTQFVVITATGAYHFSTSTDIPQVRHSMSEQAIDQL